MTIASRITVTGKATLLLPDGRKLTASKGITVSEGNTLVIDKYGSTATGTGILNATGADWAAGIGGGYKGAGGTVTINGGTVTANGGSYAAGIGGGYTGAGGTISITGGAVTATGGSRAAGIGGGERGAGGAVTINGGAVTATGGQDAVGIGAGDGSSVHGTLAIGTGVTVWVKDSEGASWESYVVDVRHRYMKAEK